MRVILLINSLYTGGAEFSTLTFYSWLKNKPDIEVRIICLKKAYPEYDIEKFGFNEVTYLNGESFIAKVKCFNKIVEEFRPDIVHSVLFDANLIGRISKILKGNFKHLESLVNQTYSPFRLKDPNISRIKLQIYRFLDYSTQIFGVNHFHSNGETVSLHYQDKLYIHPKRITNIPRGRYPNKFKDNLNEIELYHQTLKKQDKTILINVARHEHQKAQTILIEALNELMHLKEKYLLLLVGREGHLTSVLKDKINAYNLQDNVMILGHRDDVAELLAAADIFIFPSRFEGLPGALIEAESAGLPIICSDIPNNLEVVKENINALIFPVDDYKILSEKISDLILNTEKRKSFGDQSFIIFNDNFRIEKVHNDMYDLLKNIVE
jgi:glycosyltransferase involved in cell wall biosynthesis